MMPNWTNPETGHSDMREHRELLALRAVAKAAKALYNRVALDERLMAEADALDEALAELEKVR